MENQGKRRLVPKASRALKPLPPSAAQQTQEPSKRPARVKLGLRQEVAAANGSAGATAHSGQHDLTSAGPSGQGQPASTKLLIGADEKLRRLFKRSLPPNALEPKVTVSPAIPLPIEIERRKRMYSQQDIKQLLEQRGLSADDMMSRMPWQITTAENNVASDGKEAMARVGLDVFDDSDNDCRSPQEWLQLGLGTDGKMDFVPAQTLRRSASQAAEWAPVMVTEYDDSTGFFKCQFPDTMQSVQRPRAMVLFYAENPFDFVERVVNANKKAIEAEEVLMYQFLVDSIPTDDLPVLSPEQLHRILALALNVKKLKERSSDTTTLVSELNMDYARAMNRIIFDKTLIDRGSEDRLLKGLAVPSTDEIKKTVVDTPSHDFPQSFSRFHFSSLLTVPEVIQCLVKIRAECLKVHSMSMFSVKANKTMRPDEFDQLQSHAISTIGSALKENWITVMKNAVRYSLKDVGKGWFNLNESRYQIYEMSKLRQLMTQIKFMMRDSVKSMAEDAVKAYQAFICNACDMKVSVNSFTEVESTTPNGDKGNSLFLLEVTIRDGKMVPVTDLEALEKLPLTLFDKGIESLEGIPELEHVVLTEMSFASKPNLDAFSKYEPIVQDARKEIDLSLSNAFSPLKEYFALFMEFNEELLTDLETLAEKLAEVEESDLFKRILAMQKRCENARDRIPLSQTVGMFQLQLESARKQILEKLDNLLAEMRNVYAGRVRSQTAALMQGYKEVHTILTKEPGNIEDVATTRQYLDEIDPKLEELKIQAGEVTALWEKLDVFQFDFTKEDIKSRWNAFGLPFVSLQKVDDCADMLVEKKKVFEGLMMDDQDEFANEIAEVDGIVGQFFKHNDLAQVDAVAATVKKLVKRLTEMDKRSKQFNAREGLFGRPQTDYGDLARILKNFEPYQNLWLTAYDWSRSRIQWMDDPFENVDGEEMEKSITAWFRNLHKTSRFFNDKNPEIFEIASGLKAEVDDFKKYIPLVQALRQPGMRDRHWDQLTELLGFEFRPDPEFTLRKGLEELKLYEQHEGIIKICDIAGKEFGIETALDKMEGAWDEINLELLEYKDTGTFVLRGVDDLFQILDDQIVMTQSMSFSPFKKPFEERITKWEQQLQLCQEILDEWLQVQRLWMYLEPIFSSEDIQKQLPNEAKRFQTVDRNWRRTLAQANAQPHALTFCSTQRLLDMFKESNRVLDVVQKGLSDYLETKRAAFARFYFLSNDELLEILSQTRDPLAVQPHLKKCFEAIQRLDFREGSKGGHDVHAMQSSEGEIIDFVQPLVIQGSVEFWLKDVEDCMRAAVRHVLLNSRSDYLERPRPDWVINWPGQVVLATSQYYWTIEVEEAIKEGKVQQYYEKMLHQIEQLVQLVRGKLSKLSSITLGALIVIEVHARDVVNNLVKAGIESIDDFDWISQLRYYWEMEESFENSLLPLSYQRGCGEEQMTVKQVQACFLYGYEYLGNTARLVITSLTDRCYMTLTGAMHLALGGAPQGPAGTGKTETTKDLGKALAKQCVVFNCSDGLDYIAMGKFFKGLASAGAWACFDEFNRIDVEVLSVIAQQITTIQKAVQAKVSRFQFEGSEIPLDPTFAVFITMNPGYAGRAELPDNLKALFRPMAMMVPDYTLIAEISLFSFGFSGAKKLALKITTTFKLSSEQLSSQDHYDFGMRAVKTVISAAGLLKRAEPDTMEELLLLRALQDVNKPKFLAEDLILFDGIISDLFPGVEKPNPDYGVLMECIEEAVADQKLQPTEGFKTKVIQLYETTVVRHGLMLVGPTTGGKTCNYKVLASALTKCADRGVGEFRKVSYHVLNPKSVTQGQLYGSFDENTHEWSDGVLAGIIRVCASDPSEDKKWVMFDGPVDAIWIENMNTVLDDNKKLCLVSGEIISLSASMTMMFEVEDLAVASPATVSRCGMVYMEPANVGLDALCESWIIQLPEQLEDHKPTLRKLVDDLLRPSLSLLRKEMHEIVPTVDGNVTLSFFKVFNSLLAYWDEMNAKANAGGGEEDGEKASCIDLAEFVKQGFVFALTWSVGGTCDGPSRNIFSERVRSMVDQSEVKGIALPISGNLHDWQMNLQSNGWLDWMDTIPSYQLDLAKTDFSSIIVPTSDSVCYNYVLNMLVHSKHHVLGVGNTGTGKSLNIVDQLMQLPDAKYMTAFMAFSASTSANQTQDILDAKFDKRRKGVFGPPLGKTFCIFVDDLNMPAREKYFAQPPIELLRQWMDHSGWYDRKTLQFRQIIDIMMVSAMGPPGGGRNPVTNRMLRHFNFLGFADMSQKALFTIFETIIGSFVKSNFAESMHDLTSSIVKATVHIYETIAQELLPTPSKSHYTFNLRDLAKVFQGCLSAHVPSIKEDVDLIRLWAHECSRVFHDRLVDDTDRKWFFKLLQDSTLEQFGVDWERVMNTPRLLYGDYLEPGADKKEYKQVMDMEKVVRLFEEYLDDFNAQSNKQMKLVMFLDAIEHVSRISRVIRQPAGHALLLGVGGSGRQSLSRLAAFMAEFKCFQIEISKNYGKVEWRDDLKKLLMGAGNDGNNTVFVFSDTQIVQEGFLEDINGILSSGEVPNLFDGNDMESISNAMRPICQAAGIPQTKNALFAQFVKRVRIYLHVVLCFSPIGDTFRSRLRMYPSLLNNCTLDWFSEWPDEALRSVAKTQLEGIDLGAPEQETQVIEMCRVIHQSVSKKSIQFLQELQRNNAVTPTSYLELLGTCRRVMGEKRTEITEQRNRFDNGLQKLLSTADAVAVMQKELEDLQPVLQKTAKEVDEMMTVIAADKEEAAVVKVKVEKDEAEANEKARNTKAIADDAQRDLDEALPALDAAVSALKALNKNDIVEVKSMKNPPGGVRLVMEAVCIMQSVKPVRKDDPNNIGKKINDYWDPATKLLNDPNAFLQSLFNYDKDAIAESVIKQIEPYIAMDTFTPEAIQKVSKACTSICLWVRAMHKYYNVSRMVEPKRKALAEAQEELDVVLSQLAEAKAKLKEVSDRVAQLERDYEGAVAKKDELARKVRECEVKLERADKLIGGLGGEKVRWAQNIKDLEASLTNVVGDCLVAAGTVDYLGAFTGAYRASLVSEWNSEMQTRSIPHTQGASIHTTLADPVKIREWGIHGLPMDQLSVENGIILTRSRRWGLMIDPETQANRWIKNMEKANNLEVMKLTDKDYLRTLENCIRFGRPGLLENVGEELDPALEPVLLKQTFKQGGSDVIQLGDSVVPYHSDFKLYITTKLRNPYYTPETSVKIALLNFAITADGLQEQLLGKVVEEERPDLAELKGKLVVQNATMKNQMKEIEDQILAKLSAASGDILEDEALINTLAASKKTSEEIKVKLGEAEETEKEIDKTRALYVPVAYRAMILYFCISDLANIDPMYQYSLSWFLGLYTQGIRNAEPSTELDVRLQNLIEFFTYSLYVNVCRSLFEVHKLLFSFLLCIRVMQGSDKIDSGELRFLLSGATSTEVKFENPFKSWLTDSSFIEINNLDAIPVFQGFLDSFTKNEDVYKKYFDASLPHNMPLSDDWDSKLTEFQKLLILRCLRVDKVTEAVQSLVSNEMAQKFIEPPPFDLASSYSDSLVTSPLIFVFSAGSDPAADFYKFAEENDMMRKLESISLGQGQGPIAEKMIETAMERGGWVFLQNCHLAVSWMPTLERIVEHIDPESVHRDFRLWLTSEPSKAFPVSVLQDGVKMTIEPPKGLKANMIRSYNGFSDEFLAECEKPSSWRSLLFGLCFLHAIVQDRRRFGPLGWNVLYDFAQSDLYVSYLQLRLFLNDYEEIPFKVLRFLIGEINYGGRVTDDKDRRALNTMVHDYISPDVLDASHSFTSDGVYSVPQQDTNAGILEHLKGFPLNPSPEVFGLHDNADITSAQNETYNMFTNMVSMQGTGGSSSGGGKSRDDVISESANDFLRRLPSSLPLAQVMANYPTQYTESMNTVLTQEVIRFNKLLKTINRSLQDILKALKGLVVMSESLEALGTALFNNQVPSMWAGVAYPSLKPLASWVVDLEARLEFLNGWISGGHPGVYWISGFFFPQAFMTGTLQNFARKYSLPIDTISFGFKVRADLNAESPKPEDGCLIRGLYVEGAKWDMEKGVLGESRPKELFTDMPIVWLIPEANREKPTEGIYDCPVYKTLTRAGTLSTTGHSTNFVLFIELPSDMPQSHWIKRGVALMCALKF